MTRENHETIEAAVSARNGRDGFTLVEARTAFWVNATNHGSPENDIVLTTDGQSTDGIRVTNATFVVCWWGRLCVAVFYTPGADYFQILRAIGMGRPEPGDEDWDGVLPGLD